jgi:hypothetical protein
VEYKEKIADEQCTFHIPGHLAELQLQGSMSLAHAMNERNMRNIKNVYISEQLAHDHNYDSVAR